MSEAEMKKLKAGDRVLWVRAGLTCAVAGTVKERIAIGLIINWDDGPEVDMGIDFRASQNIQRFAL